jgi:shikimate dehydrogenase
MNELLQTDWDKLAYPRICGLLGVNPSRLSQAMHNAGFSELGLAFSYSAFHTLKTQLAVTCVQELGFRGLSLTIPHKESAYGLVDELSPDSKEIGAINTLINNGSKLYGFNSDWYGVVEALKEVSFEAKGQKAIILGAGGAARAAVYALKILGVGEIFICNRTRDRAKEIADKFAVNLLEMEALERHLSADCRLLINATPLGLSSDADESIYPFSLQSLGKGQIVFDMVTRETPLLLRSSQGGAKTVAGIRMLLHQAVKQFELFTEVKAPSLVMEKALLKDYQH